MFSRRANFEMSSSREPDPATDSEDPGGCTSLQEDLDSLDRHQTGESCDGYYLKLADQILRPREQHSEAGARRGRTRAP